MGTSGLKELREVWFHSLPPQVSWVNVSGMTLPGMQKAQEEANCG